MMWPSRSSACCPFDSNSLEIYLVLFADPYRNDVNFVLSVLTLEELGATGNKGLAGILINPVHANAVAGLATSGTIATHGCPSLSSSPYKP